MARTPKARVRVAEGGNDPNRLIGPFLRSDVVCAACFGIAAYLAISNTWPGIVGLCVLAGLFSGLSPRMEDQFGFAWGNAQLGGKFIRVSRPEVPPAEIRLKMRPSGELPAEEPLQEPPIRVPTPPEPPPDIGPGAG